MTAALLSIRQQSVHHPTAVTQALSSVQLRPVFNVVATGLLCNTWHTRSIAVNIGSYSVILNRGAHSTLVPPSHEKHSILPACTIRTVLILSSITRHTKHSISLSISCNPILVALRNSTCETLVAIDSVEAVEDLHRLVHTRGCWAFKKACQKLKPARKGLWKRKKGKGKVSVPAKESSTNGDKWSTNGGSAKVIGLWLIGSCGGNAAGSHHFVSLRASRLSGRQRQRSSPADNG